MKFPPAAFTRLLRGVTRLALLGLVASNAVPKRALQRPSRFRFSIAKAGHLSPLKRADVGVAALPSRKTAGLITLRASRVNAAEFRRLTRPSTICEARQLLAV